jgi:hypothetical protein
MKLISRSGNGIDAGPNVSGPGRARLGGAPKVTAAAAAAAGNIRRLIEYVQQGFTNSCSLDKSAELSSAVKPARLADSAPDSIRRRRRRRSASDHQHRQSVSQPVNLSELSLIRTSEYVLHRLTE